MYRDMGLVSLAKKRGLASEIDVIRLHKNVFVSSLFVVITKNEFLWLIKKHSIAMK